MTFLYFTLNETLKWLFLFHAHDSDIIDMKSFVKLPNRLHPLYSNKEMKSFFFYPVSALIGIKVLQGHYIWYQSIKLQRSGLMDSSTYRYDVNCVISLWDIIRHTMKENIVELTAWMVWELGVMHEVSCMKWKAICLNQACCKVYLSCLTYTFISGV